MHSLGAEGKKCVHPEFKLSAHKVPYALNNRKNGAHAGGTPLAIVHSALKLCTQGAGCTLNFEHCNSYFMTTIYGFRPRVSNN